jgi:hypothetical protein
MRIGFRSLDRYLNRHHIADEEQRQLRPAGGVSQPRAAIPAVRASREHAA